MEPGDVTLQGGKQQTPQDSEERMESKSASDSGRVITSETFATSQGEHEPEQPDNEQDPVSQSSDSSATVTKT